MKLLTLFDITGYNAWTSGGDVRHILFSHWYFKRKQIIQKFILIYLTSLICFLGLKLFCTSTQKEFSNTKIVKIRQLEFLK